MDYLFVIKFEDRTPDLGDLHNTIKGLEGNGVEICGYLTDEEKGVIGIMRVTGNTEGETRG